MSITRRGLFGVAAAAVSARKLPAMVPPGVRFFPFVGSQVDSNRLAEPFTLTREMLQATLDSVLDMPDGDELRTWYIDGDV